MILQLSLETGDVTTKAKELRRFQVEVDTSTTTVHLRLGNSEGEVPFTDWPLLVEQVKARALVKRHFPNGLEPPLEEVAAVIKEINSTPTYQLFLAGIDIAERIDLASDSPPEAVKRRFALLKNWMPSVTGAGGLFFVTDNLLARYSPQAMADLLKNNKLCAGRLDDTTRYYVPYATPMGFILPVGQEAERLWEEIRSLYNAFRYPA